jgi:tRNA(Arg) A34 adenosine deaminase TadA
MQAEACTPNMNSSSLRKGDLLTEAQLDDAVHDLVLHALSLGMIPIAGIMSERQADGQHRVVGFGWNHLREGIPGIHGETGAIMNMGRLTGGYRHLTATSSLSPCPFCQGCLALHLGLKEIRILDATNYKPDFTRYGKVGLSPTVSEHPGIVRTFRKWVRDRKNATVWSRDIGLFKGKVSRPFDVKRNRQRARDLMELANQKALEGEQAGEAPVGAVIVDPAGEVIGAGHPKIVTNNDPSMVAAMSAWRACGAREHWKDKTLLLTCGPDHIAYSMFHVFNFGQLVVGGTDAFKGQIDAVRKLGVPVHVLRGIDGAILKSWLMRQPAERTREYFGADFVGT